MSLEQSRKEDERRRRNSLNLSRFGKRPRPDLMQLGSDLSGKATMRAEIEIFWNRNISVSVQALDIPFLSVEVNGVTCLDLKLVCNCGGA
jgi:hypothetical protein